jgi:hypothetical protein
VLTEEAITPALQPLTVFKVLVFVCLGLNTQGVYMIKNCFLMIAVSLCVAMSAFAQTDRGTITGTVADATGAVIPGVAIEAKNVSTGAVYQAGSSETGNYTLPQLPVRYL